MGMILVAALFVVAVIWLHGAGYLAILVYNKQMSVPTIFLGLLLSVALFAGVLLNLYMEKSVWLFLPYFSVCLWVFYVPGAVGFIAMLVQKPMMQNLAKVISVSVSFSGVMFLLFYNKLAYVVTALGVEQRY